MIYIHLTWLNGAAHHESQLNNHWFLEGFLQKSKKASFSWFFRLRKNLSSPTRGFPISVDRGGWLLREWRLQEGTKTHQIEKQTITSSRLNRDSSRPGPFSPQTLPDESMSPQKRDVWLTSFNAKCFTPTLSGFHWIWAEGVDVPISWSCQWRLPSQLPLLAGGSPAPSIAWTSWERERGATGTRSSPCCVLLYIYISILLFVYCCTFNQVLGEWWWMDQNLQAQALGFWRNLRNPHLWQIWKP